MIKKYVLATILILMISMISITFASSNTLFNSVKVSDLETYRINTRMDNIDLTTNTFDKSLVNNYKLFQAITIDCYALETMANHDVEKGTYKRIYYKSIADSYGIYTLGNGFTAFEVKNNEIIHYDYDILRNEYDVTSYPCVLDIGDGIVVAEPDESPIWFLITKTDDQTVTIDLSSFEFPFFQGLEEDGRLLLKFYKVSSIRDAKEKASQLVNSADIFAYLKDNYKLIDRDKYKAFGKEITRAYAKEYGSNLVFDEGKYWESGYIIDYPNNTIEMYGMYYSFYNELYFYNKSFENGVYKILNEDYKICQIGVSKEKQFENFFVETRFELQDITGGKRYFYIITPIGNPRIVMPYLIKIEKYQILD